RATSACHSPAAERTSTTAPSVSAARKVMIAITARSARPAIESAGTIEAAASGSAPMAGAGALSSSKYSLCAAIAASLRIGVQLPFMQHKPGRVIEVHQGDIVGRDQDGGAGPVELDEKMQQPARQAGVDIAGRL